MNPTSSVFWGNVTPEQRAAWKAKAAGTRARNKQQRVAAVAVSRVGVARGRRLLDPQTILRAAVPFVVDCGVYFLVKNKTIVYVGQSINIAGRVSTHRATGKDFDSCAYIPCARGSLDAIESFYIHTLAPVLNMRCVPGGAFCAPMTLKEAQAVLELGL